MILRPPAVAGRFYPAEPDRLRRSVRMLLDAAGTDPEIRPKALIAPHAGYAFSGAVAGAAVYAVLRATPERPRAASPAVLIQQEENAR